MADALISLLSKTGYDLAKHSSTDLKWVEDIDGLSDFFQWIAQAITDENCITPEDIQMYNFLKSNKKLVPEEVLEQMLNKYMSTEEELNTFEGDVDCLQEELELKKVEILRLTNLKGHLSSQLNKIQTDKCSNRIDFLLEEELKKIDSLNENYKEELTNLEKSFHNFHDVFTSISMNESQQYLCQKSLHNFVNDMSSMEIYLKSIKDFYFKESQDEENKKVIIYKEFRKPEFIESQLNRVFNSILQLEINDAMVKSEIAGIDAVLKYFNEAENFDPNWFLNVFEESSDVVVSFKNDELTKACETHVCGIFQKNQLRFVEEKGLRKSNTLRQLKEFESIVKPMKLYSECIIFLLKKEWKWIRVSIHLLNDTLKCLQDVIDQFNFRKAWMNRMILMQEMTISNTKNTTLSMSLNKLINSTQMEDCEDGDLATQVQSVTMSLTIQENSVLSKLHNHYAEVNRLLRNIKQMDEFLVDGPTRMPSINPKLLHLLSQVECDMRSVRSNTILLAKQCNGFMEILESDRHKKKLHNLWIDYLNNSYSVLNDTLTIEKEAKNVLEYKNILMNRNQGDYLKAMFNPR